MTKSNTVSPSSQAMAQTMTSNSSLPEEIKALLSAIAGNTVPLFSDYILPSREHKTTNLSSGTLETFIEGTQMLIQRYKRNTQYMPSDLIPYMIELMNCTDGLGKAKICALASYADKLKSKEFTLNDSIMICISSDILGLGVCIKGKWERTTGNTQWTWGELKKTIFSLAPSITNDTVDGIIKLLIKSGDLVPTKDKTALNSKDGDALNTILDSYLHDEKPALTDLYSIDPTALQPLTETQKDFAYKILNTKKRMIFLTGPGGTGKTTTIGCILRALPSSCKVYATAPTGVASRVLSQSLGNISAVTIDKLLTGTQYQKETEDSTDTNLLIIDECSMASAHHLRILDVLFPDRIIFLGDPDQLPPVQPGDFLRNANKLSGVLYLSLYKNLRASSQETADKLTVIRETSKVKISERLAFASSASIQAKQTACILLNGPKLDSKIDRLDTILQMAWSKNWNILSQRTDVIALLSLAYLEGDASVRKHFLKLMVQALLQTKREASNIFELSTKLNIDRKNLNVVWSSEPYKILDKSKDSLGKIYRGFEGICDGRNGIEFITDLHNKVTLPLDSLDLRARYSDIMLAMVTNVHKAQGRSFDNVLYLMEPPRWNPDTKHFENDKLLAYTALSRSRGAAHTLTFCGQCEYAFLTEGTPRKDAIQSLINTEEK